MFAQNNDYVIQKNDLAKQIMDAKKISIIIPTYNQSKYILKTVKSALMQNYENLEVIVVDDASTDNTFELLSSFFLDKRFKYVKNERNLGRVANYRTGLFVHATGDYVLNLDGDDYLIDSSFVKNAANVLDTNPSVMFYIANCFTQYNSTEERNYFNGQQNLSTIVSGVVFVENIFFGKQFFYHLSCVYRRKNAIDLNFYKIDSVWTDGLSLLNLACNGDVAVCNSAVGVWRLHGENESRKFYKNAEYSEIFQCVDYISSMHPSISRKAVYYFNYINIFDFTKYLIKNAEFLRMFGFYRYAIKHKFGILIKYGLVILIRVIVNSMFFLRRKIFSFVMGVVK